MSKPSIQLDEADPIGSPHHAKRLKTTHTLPVTHNGTTVTVTVADHHLDADTEISVQVSRADGQAVPTGTLALAAAASTPAPADPTTADERTPGQGDGTLRCLKLSPELTAGLLETKHPHPRDARIKFRESDHKPV